MLTLSLRRHSKQANVHINVYSYKVQTHIFINRALEIRESSLFNWPIFITLSVRLIKPNILYFPCFPEGLNAYYGNKVLFLYPPASCVPSLWSRRPDESRGFQKKTRVEFPSEAALGSSLLVCLQQTVLTYLYCRRGLWRRRAPLGCQRGQRPPPPGCPAAWWPRGSALCCSCLARTSRLRDAEGYPRCRLLPAFRRAGEKIKNKQRNT